jgi:hypothetical protein
MIRIRYEPIADRVETHAVLVRDGHIDWLAGHVHLSADGRWTARPRAVRMRDAVSGWASRSDAARWLLIHQKFAREPDAGSLWSAAA